MTNNIQKYDFKEGLPQEFEIIDFDLLLKEFSEEIPSDKWIERFHDWMVGQELIEK